MKPYYDRDGIVIYHGDCRKLWSKLPIVDLVLVDPPYGIDLKSNGQLLNRMKTIEGDGDLKLAETIYSLCANQQLPLAMFYTPYLPTPGKFRSILVWNKGKHVGIGGDRETCWKRDFELIGVASNRILNGKRDSSVLRYNAIQPGDLKHIAEKPVSLLSHMIGKLTQPGDLVLDPCMGVGSTLQAAKDMGRRAVGIEIEERYCEIAAKQLRKGFTFPMATKGGAK